MAFSVYDLYEVAFRLKRHLSLRPTQQRAARQERPRGTQREYNLQPLKHSIVKCILVFKR